MREWWMSGGFGMFLVAATGLAGLGFGVKTIGYPSRANRATLKALPGLVMALAMFAFGVNTWAVNLALASGRFPKDELAAIGMNGLTESTQVLTLGGLLAAIVIVTYVIASVKAARMEDDGPAA